MYRKLLEDASLAVAQGGPDGFRSWDEAVNASLSDPERDIYRANAPSLNVRLDNYHRRLFRNQVLVRLFGYPLGTTFAQQFGLSSEGLDATKSLSVACFFATHQ